MADHDVAHFDKVVQLHRLLRRQVHAAVAAVARLVPRVAERGLPIGVMKPDVVVYGIQAFTSVWYSGSPVSGFIWPINFDGLSLPLIT